MYIVLSFITIFFAIALILVVLVQNSKGGGLASNFSSSNQIMGAPKTADFLEKATWFLAGTIIVLSLISAKLVSTGLADPGIKSLPIENTETPDMESPLPEAQIPATIPAPAE